MTLKSYKLGDGIVQTRQEVERRVPAFPQDGSHPLVAEHVAGRSGGLRSGDLRKLFRVRTHRRLFDIRLHDDTSVQVGIDRTTITTDGPVKKPAPGRMTFVELEIELKQGREESLRQLAAETQQRFGLLAGPSQQVRTRDCRPRACRPRGILDRCCRRARRSCRRRENGSPRRPIRPSTWPMAACSSNSRR